MFRIIVPLDEAYSYDFERNGGSSVRDTIDTDFDLISDTINTNFGTNPDTIDAASASRHFTAKEHAILELLKENASLTQMQIQEKLGYSLTTVKRIIKKLQEEGVITRVGNNRSGEWRVNQLP